MCFFSVIVGKAGFVFHKKYLIFFLKALYNASFNFIFFLFSDTLYLVVLDFHFVIYFFNYRSDEIVSLL